MKAVRLLLPAIALTAMLGCDKSESGKGMTEPSPRNEGVEQPPAWQPEKNPGTMPTQGAAPSGDTLNEQNPITPDQDNTNTRGQTTTPPTAYGRDAGAMGGTMP